MLLDPHCGILQSRADALAMRFALIPFLFASKQRNCNGTALSATSCSDMWTEFLGETSTYDLYPSGNC
jgi:hypothetical protein